MDTHIIELLVTVLIGVLGSNGLWAFLQSISGKKSARDRMILGLGHAEIFRLCERYLARGGITADELDDLVKYLYQPYADLGGNGTVTALIGQVKNLPIIAAKDAAEKDKEMGLI